MPEALTLSRRDIIAYLSLLVDESEQVPDEDASNETSEVEEALRRCHALQ